MKSLYLAYHQKVQILKKELAPYLNVPYLFFGHSNGALTAYELARALQISGNNLLRHIILSAKRAPHLPLLKKPVADLPYHEFIEVLKSYASTPTSILENEDAMKFYMPMLRADFSLSEKHHFDKSFLLNAKGTLLWGNQDHNVPKEDMAAWNELFSQPLDLMEVTGGHFFINEQRELVLEKLQEL